MVERIEIYNNVLKVILKPTKKFPEGYFYTDNIPEAFNLVKNYSWFLHQSGNNTYIEAYKDKTIIQFHQEYANKLLGYYPDYIDHINRVELDNRNENLNVVTKQQNGRNRTSKGYGFRYTYFQPNYVLDGKTYYRGSFKSEPETLLAIYQLRQEIFSDYNYNFFLDRRDDEDILDAELTGKITTEQAIYYHVKRYVESNPWYAYRYNLFDYCKQNSIRIPDFELDSQGFMIHPVTKQRLCPY